MLRQVASATCRYGCKYKGEGCIKLKNPVVARSQVYQASLERCARVNNQEIEEPLLVEVDERLEKFRHLGPRSGSRMSSIARRGEFRS